MSADVVVVGSLNMDLVATAERVPLPGETMLGGGFVTVAGGKGANQAVAAALAGSSCALVGAAGDDIFGDRLVASLSESGVDISRVRRVSGPSGVALIVVADDGENAIVVAPGANAQLSPLDDGDLELIGAASVVVAQLEVPQPTVAAAAAATNGLFILNAAPAAPLTPDLAGAVGLLVVNQSEAATLSGTDRGDDQIARLLSIAPRVVVTMGAAGSRFAERDGTDVSVPAPSVPVVDTTGAGDAFCGALAAALAGGRAPTTAIKWAGAAASLAVQRRGAAAMPSQADIDAWHERSYGLTLRPHRLHIVQINTPWSIMTIGTGTFVVGR